MSDPSVLGEDEAPASSNSFVKCAQSERTSKDLHAREKSFAILSNLSASEKITSVLAICSLLIGLASLITAIVSYRSSVNAAQMSAAISRLTGLADQADKQSHALEDEAATDRSRSIAYVDVTSARLVDFKKGGHASATAYIKNVGSTPAFDLAPKCAADIQNTPPDLDLLYATALRSHTSPSTLGSGETRYFIVRENDKLSSTDYVGVTSGSKAVYLACIGEYTDILGKAHIFRVVAAYGNPFGHGPKGWMSPYVSEHR